MRLVKLQKPLRCDFCGQSCRRTVRDSTGKLYQCCKKCRNEQNLAGNGIVLYISSVFKAEIFNWEGCEDGYTD